MNKKANIILAMLLAVVGVFSLTSCKDDEPTVAKAVLCSVFSLDFDANGGSQEVKVVSDAMWHVEAPDWITVSPETGEGTTFVTITAKSNYEGTEMNARRNADVIFKGNTKESEAVVVVRQDGDGYKGVVPCTGAEFYTKANEAVVIVKDMTVVATYAGGIIATDGASNVYAVIADRAAALPSLPQLSTSQPTSMPISPLSSHTLLFRVSMTQTQSRLPTRPIKVS